MNGKNRIMIFGPKDDGTYVVEFRTASGEALAISECGEDPAGRRGGSSHDRPATAAA
jgi:hypothetical protein